MHFDPRHHHVLSSILSASILAVEPTTQILKARLFHMTGATAVSTLLFVCSYRFSKTLAN